jgi:hypothetical protein
LCRDDRRNVTFTDIVDLGAGLPVEVGIRHCRQLIGFVPSIRLRLFVEPRGLGQGVSVWRGLVLIERFWQWGWCARQST